MKLPANTPHRTKSFIAITTALGLSVILVSCGSSDSSQNTLTDGSSGDNSNVSETLSFEEQVEENNQKVFDTYKNKVLSNPGEVQLGDAADYNLDGTYSYAIVEATGDSSPDLLLKVNAKEMSPVFLFTTQDSPDNLIQSSNSLTTGVASSGGSRKNIESSASGIGIYQISSQAMSPDATSSLYTLEGTTLTETESTSLGQGWESSPIPDHQEIQWHDVTDYSGLNTDALPELSQPTQEAESPEQQPAPNPEEPPAEQPREEAPEIDMNDGQNHLTGTVQEMTTDEVMKGQRPPNGESASNTYLILVLDQPTTATAASSGSQMQPRTETVTEVSLYDKDKWSQYVGQHITVSGDPADATWPSDTGLPLGLIRIPSSYEVSAG